MYQTISILLADTPEQILYGYGPLGIGVVFLAFAVFKMFNILINDRDKAIQQRDDLLNDFMTKILPAMTKNTEVLGDVSLILRERAIGGNPNKGGPSHAPLE